MKNRNVSRSFIIFTRTRRSIAGITEDGAEDLYKVPSSHRARERVLTKQCVIIPHCLIIEKVQNMHICEKMCFKIAQTFLYCESITLISFIVH